MAAETALRAQLAAAEAKVADATAQYAASLSLAVAMVYDDVIIVCRRDDAVNRLAALSEAVTVALSRVTSLLPSKTTPDAAAGMSLVLSLLSADVIIVLCAAQAAGAAMHSQH